MPLQSGFSKTDLIETFPSGLVLLKDAIGSVAPLVIVSKFSNPSIKLTSTVITLPTSLSVGTKLLLVAPLMICPLAYH